MKFFKYGLLEFIVIFVFAFFAQKVNAFSAKFTPTVKVEYRYNDNIRAEDEEVADPTGLQWVNYFLGLDATLKNRRTTLNLGGWVGYSQYLAIDGGLADIANLDAVDFDYPNIYLHAGFQYLTPKFTFDLEDEFKQNRRASEIIGVDISDFSEYYLYINNIASAQVRFRTGGPFSGLFRYQYQITNFEKPEEADTFPPPNSESHTGYLALNYRISPRFDVQLDVHGGAMTYEDQEYYVSPGVSDWLEVTDYTYVQSTLGVNWRLSPKSLLHFSAGAQWRDFYGEAPGREFEDFTLPVARISFNHGEKYRYELGVGGEYAPSVYGLNYYFNYWQADAHFKFWVRRPLYLYTDVYYKQNTFDRDMIDMDGVWVDDRVDNVTIARAGVVFDALRRHEVPYLSFQLEYTYNLRESNIDEGADYVGGYGPSYDMTNNYIIFSMTFNPSLLIK